MCPFNKFNIRLTSIWITFFIKYSNRAKYKIQRYFSWSKQNLDSRSCYRKFCRKTTIDVPFETKFWIEKNAQLEKKLWTLYSNPKTKNLIFALENIDKIRELLMGYSYIQSLQVRKVLPNLRTQINQQNLPYDIERLQCIFIESFCISILAVFELSKSLDANFSEVKVFFFKRNSKYASCAKKHLLEKIAQFRFKLLGKCNLKSIKQGCREKKVRFTWFLRKNVCGQPLFRISTITSRVLRCIIT